MVKCKHPGCKYRSVKCDCCIYILIEHRPRPCPPGECRGIYAPREGIQSFFGLPRRTGVEVLSSEDQLWMKYFDGWTDDRIAAHFGVPVRYVAGWRRSNDLPVQREASEEKE